MVSSELSDHKPGVLTALRVLCAFFSAAIIVALILWATRGTTTYDPDRATKRYANLKKLNDDNAKKIGEYAVVDKAKGIYQLPLKAAITLTAKDLAKIQPHSAYPVVTTPAPAAAPAPDAPVAAPSATPASNTPSAAPAATPVATPANDKTEAAPSPEAAPAPVATPAAQP